MENFKAFKPNTLDTEISAQFHSILQNQFSPENYNWQTENDPVLAAFIATPLHQPLFVWLSAGKVIYVDTQKPLKHDGKILFFIRNDLKCSKNLFQLLNFGSQGSPTTDSTFFSLLDGVYAPLLSRNKQIPPGVISELQSNINGFLASYFDTKHHSSDDAAVAFYVPREDLNHVSSDLIRRLESLTMHWTMQMKSVMMNSHVKQVNNAGLMQEVEFWKQRSVALTALHKEIEKHNVQKIVKILENANSFHVEQFRSLASAVFESSEEAQSNIEFLDILIEPCSKLGSADTKTIYQAILRLIVCIRVISTGKSFQNGEKIGNLCRRLCHDIVSTCTNFVPIDSILSADTARSLEYLNDVIDICNAWKTMFTTYQKHMLTLNPHWDIDKVTVFSESDALLQRCAMLKEVVECQVQYSLVKNGKKHPYPFFPVTSGPDIQKTFEETDAQFMRLVSTLFQNRDLVLDMEKSEWLLSFGNFRRELKDLERRLFAAMNVAFDEATSLEKKVDVYLIAYSISHRDAFKVAVTKRGLALGKSFIDSLSKIKAHHEKYRTTPEILRIHPDDSGSAFWGESLIRRASFCFSLFEKVETLFSEAQSVQIRSTFDALREELDEYVKKVHATWHSTVTEPLLPLLSRPILARNEASLLVVNFPRFVAVAIAESKLWNTLKMDIPVTVQDVVSKDEKLRACRLGAERICQTYNGIVKSIPMELKGLFEPRLQIVDRKISPGLTMLTWMTKGSIDAYVKDCMKTLTDVQITLDSLFGYFKTLLVKAVHISSTALFLNEPKKIYSLDEFISFQASFRQIVKDRLLSTHQDMQMALKSIFELVQLHQQIPGSEINSTWMKFVDRVDLVIEGALRVSMKNSLQSLSKYINGTKTETAAEIQPIFIIELVLENQKIDFNPPLQKLEEQVNKIAREMISSIAVVPKLSDFWNASDAMKHQQPIKMFYDSLVMEEDVLKILAAIQAGISTNSAKCLSFTKQWDGYREIWEINKDAFIRRYAKLKPSTATFDADIGRYNEVANNVQTEETFKNVSLIRLDCLPLKNTIVSHCNSWKEKLSTLLASNATFDLKSFTEMINQRKSELNIQPVDLDSLSALSTILATQRETVPEIQQKLFDIQEQFQVLEKYNLPPKETEQLLLDKIEVESGNYLKSLVEAEKQAEEAKSRLRTEALLEKQIL